MINVSKEFQLLMNERTDFTENAQITFANGTVINLTEKDFTVSNNSMVDSAETNGIPLGVAICRNVQIELMNDDDRFSQYDFFGAKIRLYLSFSLSETTEKIEYGTFTVLTPETYGETVIITALDDMHKADKEYNTNLVFPATIGTMLIDACTTLGISLGTTTFLNDSFIVNEKPSGITFRQLFGYIAMIAGGNARIDRTGRLRIYTYNFSNMESIYNSVLNGGSYNPWDNPVNVDGGSFAPWDNGDSVDGGAFGDRNHFHVLGNWSNLKVDTDDVVITGVKTNYYDAENNEQSVIYGADGYVLLIDNPLIAGKEQSAVYLIGNVMVGGRFRQFSGDLVSNPTCEFMDPAILLDRKGNVYISFITDINFQFFGFTSLKNSAEPALRNSSKSYSDATKTLVTARKLVAEERTAREKAVEQLAKDLQESSGLFMTKEPQADGSTIYYMHDKPTLKESMVVWKLTALAFAISTDGGKTYPYGFTVNGEVITRLLYAEGIDADYIDTGAIKINDENGNTIFSVDYDTKKVFINAENVMIGNKTVVSANSELSKSISDETKRAQDQEVELAAAISLIDGKVELKASKGELSSLISVESGEITIKSNRFSWESTNSSLTTDGKLTAKDVDLTGKITADDGEIGGFTIGQFSLHTKSKTSLTSTFPGIYIGTDGIAVGDSFKVLESGGVSLGYNTDIEVGGTLKFNNAAWNGIKYNDYTIFTINSSTRAMEVAQEIKAGKGIELTDNLTMASNTSYIKGLAATNYKIKFETSRTTIMDTYSVLGKNAGYVGFFGKDGAVQKSVTSITTPSTATASTVATKLNELLTALKAYNLIG